MSDKGQLNNKDVQRHSNAVTGAVLGEMERLKADLELKSGCLSDLNVSYTLFTMNGS
jgi:hypothetical protein